jgi:hypothetical protein
LSLPPSTSNGSEFEFDVLVRFDADMLDVTLDIQRLASITSILLIEVRS